MGKTKTLLIAAATTAAAALIVRRARREAGSVARYRGGRNSKTIHRPGCRYYDSSRPARVFQSIQEALDSGYRQCKVCLG